MMHDWPGNVRELENCLTRAAVLSESDVIRPDHLDLTPPEEEEEAIGTLDSAEKSHVMRALETTGGNKLQAAEMLGVSRPRLDRLVEKHGLADLVTRLRSPERREGAFLTVSFRARILFIVLALGTIPPLLLGLWLTRSGTRTSQALVVSQIEEVLEETVPTIISRWIGLRSQLLDLTDAPSVQSALASPATMEGGISDAGTGQMASPDGVVSVRFQAVGGEPVSPSPLPLPEVPPMGTGPTILTEFTVYSRADGQSLGTMVAEIDPRALLPESALMPSGGVFGLFDASTGGSLLPRAFDRPLLSGDRFVWGGEEWIARRSVLDDPGITVAVAAPLTPFIRPFEETAGRATLLLLSVAVLGFLVAVSVTRRLTGSMQALADAAEAVAGGDLERTIDVRGRDEVGRAAKAFNVMTESLRKTLAELSSRESLAAMGEFAASLAHEVRNPLTAIRIDLERVEEGIPEESELKTPQERALREIVAVALLCLLTGPVSAQSLAKEGPSPGSAGESSRVWWTFGSLCGPPPSRRALHSQRAGPSWSPWSCPSPWRPEETPEPWSSSS